MYATVFDIPGYWEMDDYGTAIEVMSYYGSVYFNSLQSWHQYHC